MTLHILHHDCGAFSSLPALLLSLTSHTRYMKGFGIKQGCDAKINCCRLAQHPPVRDEGIGWTHSPSPCFFFFFLIIIIQRITGKYTILICKGLQASILY